MLHARVAAAVCALALFAVWPASSAAQSPGAKTPPPKSQAAKAPAKRAPDAAIEAAIKARLARSKIAEDGFQVRVQGGTAILEGRTEVVQRKGTATRLAKAAGAKSVDNRIYVSDAARQKAAASLERGRRRAQIKRGDARSETPSQAKTKR